MSWPPKALVYSTERGLIDASKLLGSKVVLERAVQEAVLRGDFHPKRAAGELGRAFDVDLDGGLVARCIRVPGRIRPEPWAWSVRRTEVRKPNEGGERNGNEDDAA
jgi:hypothetical protein